MRVSTDGQTHARTHAQTQNDFIICPMLAICYSYGADNNRRECDTISKALEKSRRMASIWLESSMSLARSLTVVIRCVSQDLPLQKLCCCQQHSFCKGRSCWSDRMLWCSRCFMMLLCNTYSITLVHTAVREIGQ